MSYTDMVDRSGALQASFTAVARIPKPTVAAITGYALGGGCELALCVRLPGRRRQRQARPARDPARHHPRRRRHPAAARLVGPARAKDLIFSGRFVDADEALAIGLVDEVVPADEVYAAARDAGRAGTSAARRYALRAAKEAIDRGLETDLETGLEIERLQFAGLFATRGPRDRHGVVRRERPGQGHVRGR